MQKWIKLLIYLISLYEIPLRNILNPHVCEKKPTKFQETMK